MRFLTDRRLWFRIGLSGGLVALLVWRVDIGEALQTFTEVNYLFVLPALAVFTFSKLVDAYRWRLMLSGLGSAPLSELFGIYLVHNLANNLLP
ncbi:MAG: lysylphosphatidylglycerol synthase domain-containing protein, partial [Dehalococcoidia bacterium]